MPRSTKSILVFLLGFTIGCQEVGARHDIQEGNKLYYDGKYDDAIKRYKEALAVNPLLDVGWFNMGLAHLALFAPGLKTPENEKRAMGAIDALEHYLQLQPKDTQARDFLVSTYIDSGHYELAIQYFEKQYEKDPTSIESIAQLAQINQQAGKYDEAIKWFKKKGEMVKTLDEKADAWYSIGVLDWRRLNGHSDIEGEARMKIADEGIGWLQKGDEARKGHSATLSYLNLLYRERALASEMSYGRVADTATSQYYYKLATEAAKKQ
jgi:tetratricopeptide (TPR) repeat protein